jgi:hypothetical protein
MESDKPARSTHEPERLSEESIPYLLEALRHLEEGRFGANATTALDDFVLTDVFELQPDITPSLYEALADSDFVGHRESAAIGAGHLVNVDRSLAMELLERLLTDAEWKVGRAARETLDGLLDRLDPLEATRLILAHRAGARTRLASTDDL